MKTNTMYALAAALMASVATPGLAQDVVEDRPFDGFYIGASGG